MADGAVQRAHRPQLARSALQQRIVHRKRQARLALPAARRHGTTRAQRVVEVGRVHLRALVRRACAQPRQCIAGTAKRLHERAIARTVLQADRVKAVVKRVNVRRERWRAQAGGIKDIVQPSHVGCASERLQRRVTNALQ